MKVTGSLIALFGALLASTVHANPNSELLRGRDMLIVSIDLSEADNPLRDYVAAKGTLRCWAQDHEGVAAGCYIGVTRRAKLVLPEFLPPSNHDDVPSHRTLAFSPALAGKATVTAIAAKGQGDGAQTKLFAVTLPDALGVGLALYSDCNPTTLLHCDDQNGESYRHGVTDPKASFVVAADGSIRRYTRDVARTVDQAVVAAAKSRGGIQNGH